MLFFSLFISFSFLLLLPFLSFSTSSILSQFLIVSDLHLDLSFSLSSSPYSPFCSLSPSTNQDSFSFGFNHDSPLGVFGCDPPLSLIRTTFADMARTCATPRAVIVVGDVSVHCGACDQINIFNGTNVIRAMENVLENIRIWFPTTEVVMTLGNNDVYPDYDLNVTATEWLRKVADVFVKYNVTFNRTTFLQAGYSSTDLVVSETVTVKVVSLNTLLYAKYNPYLNVNTYSNSLDGILGPKTFGKRLTGSKIILATNDNEVTYPPVYPDKYLPPHGYKDPAGQFDLLRADLNDCLAGSKRLLLFGHIGPMTDSYAHKSNWFHNYTVQFANLLKDYAPHASSVVGEPLLIFSHQHEATYRFFPYLQDTPSISPFNPLNISVAVTQLLVSAVSPIYYNYPTYRVLNLDASNGNLLDFSDYILNISTLSESYVNLMSATSAFNTLSPITTASLSASLFTALVLGKEPYFSNFCHDDRRDALSGAFASWYSSCKGNGIAQYCNMIATENVDYVSCLKTGSPLPTIAPNTSAPASGQSAEYKLSTATIAGVVLVSIFVFFLVGAIVYRFWVKRDNYAKLETPFYDSDIHGVN